MFTIILQDKENKEIKRVFSKNNEKFLLRVNSEKFTLLSELSGSSYDVFGSNHMQQLIKELMDIKISLSNEKEIEHVDKIIVLVTECKKYGYKLCFTPFGRF